jgi:CDP-glucose 4,6-dehydratase
MELIPKFWKDKKVLITGHTGFKGSWLCLVLNELGADIYGFSLPPNTTPNLYTEAKINEKVTSYFGDVRNYEKLNDVIQDIQPEIIIHMAAQALVMESYRNPRDTFEINIMGTVNLLDSAKTTKNVKAIVNVTTDKCYENKEWHWGYRENEPMGGYDPYSSSKGCSELITAAYRNSFFNLKENGIALASARAGNVIGGGDWARDRLIPDFIRAITKGHDLKIRSPYAVRPWQHVLEPLSGYLNLAFKLFHHGSKYAEAWNFGPDDSDAQNVEWISKTLCEIWGDGASYNIDTNPQPYEAKYLKLDCSKAKAELGWSPKWSINTSLASIVHWNKAYLNKENIFDITTQQIKNYFKEVSS